MLITESEKKVPPKSPKDTQQRMPLDNLMFEPFQLFANDDISLKNAAAFVDKATLNKQKVVVVSVIGKEQIGVNIKKKIAELLVKRIGKKQQNCTLNTSKNVISIDGTETVVASENQHHQVQVGGLVDIESNLIVLHLSSFLDPSQLIQLFDELKTISCSSETICDNWPPWNQNLVKTLLILFLMSHMVIFYNPDLAFDFSCLHLLQTLDILRLKSKPRISELYGAIKTAQIFPQQWIREARVTCPRALFLCDGSQYELEINDIKSLETELEDQIYRLFKKCQLINRQNHLLSHSSSTKHQPSNLVNVPNRDNFVYILTQSDIKTLGIESKIQQTQKNEVNIKSRSSTRPSRMLAFLSQSEDLDSSVSANDELSLDDESVFIDGSNSTTPPIVPERNVSESRLKNFLKKHIDQVSQGQQASNRTGRATGSRSLTPRGPRSPSAQQVQSTVFLPRYDDFFKALLRLKNLMFPILEQTCQSMPISSGSVVASWNSPDERRFIDIYDSFDTDRLFSQRHCFKARLAAFDLYTRGLSSTYDYATHEERLSSARQLYTNHARGVACSPNLDFLIEQCNEYWNEGRLQIKARGQRKLQQLKDEAISSNLMSIIRHLNGVKLITGCDCGRKVTFLITPSDKKTKKLERIEIEKISDIPQ